MAEEKKNQVAVTEDSKYTITTRTGERINLSMEVVKKQIAGNADITTAEFYHFFQLCKVNKVNPLTGDAYLVKYDGKPAQIMIAEKVLEQAAEVNPNYSGMKHGIVVTKKDGTSEERSMEVVLPGETLVAAWAEVYRKDRQFPTKNYAMLNEYTKGQATWKQMQTHMLIKCAKASALREAFPNLFDNNVSTIEEKNAVDIGTLDLTKNVEAEAVSEKKPEVKEFVEAEVQVKEAAPAKDIKKDPFE